MNKFNYLIVFEEGKITLTNQPEKYDEFHNYGECEIIRLSDLSYFRFGKWQKISPDDEDFS